MRSHRRRLTRTRSRGLMTFCCITLMFPSVFASSEPYLVPSSHLFPSIISPSPFMFVCRHTHTQRDSPQQSNLISSKGWQCHLVSLRLFKFSSLNKCIIHLIIWRPREMLQYSLKLCWVNSTCSCVSFSNSSKRADLLKLTRLFTHIHHWLLKMAIIWV